MREKLTLSQKEEGDARGDEMLNDLAEENTTKSGFRNSHLAQEYHKLTEGAKRACRDVIVRLPSHVISHTTYAYLTISFAG